MFVIGTSDRVDPTTWVHRQVTRSNVRRVGGDFGEINPPNSTRKVVLFPLTRLRDYQDGSDYPRTQVGLKITKSFPLHDGDNP